MKVLPELDREQLYTLRDNMETWWRFIWEPTPDMRGWYAWRKDPSMEKWVCLGTLSETRVLQVLNSQPEPFTLDDSIDFHIWLEEYFGPQTENHIDDSTKEPACSEEGSQAPRQVDGG